MGTIGGEVGMVESVTVLIVTFARPEMLRKTINGFLKHNNYPYLKFHLADNDTTKRFGIKNYVPALLDEYSDLEWSYTIEKKPGWGNNVNAALRAIKTDLVFLIEDDRMAYAKINLADGVTLLQHKRDVGLVRYDGIAGHTDTVLKLREIKTKNTKFSYCTIDNRLSRRAITYSNQPHLRHKRFTEFYGLYPENVTLGHCERLYASNVKRNPGGPQIAILEDGIQNRFTHLGAGKNSRQHSAWDKK